MSRKPQVKEVVLDGVKIKIVSKKAFADIIGFSFRKVEDWISKGIFLPPTFKDDSHCVVNWKKEKVSKKYYSYLEAVAVRSLLKGKVFGRRREIKKEFIDEIHSVMLNIRNNLKNYDVSVFNYPIVLEFKNSSDFIEWFEKFYSQSVNSAGIIDIEVLASNIYRAGNKFIFKEEDNKNGSD